MNALFQEVKLTGNGRHGTKHLPKVENVLYLSKSIYLKMIDIVQNVLG